MNKYFDFEDVYFRKVGNSKLIYTENLVIGDKVYGEELFLDDGIEYRNWDPSRSKLGAYLLCGGKDIGFGKGDAILYLGGASGTTLSHVSDVVGNEGICFGVDLAATCMRQLVFLAEKRKNIVPILCDCNFEEEMVKRVFMCDCVFQDIAQKNQVEIFLKNVDLFLKKGGYGLISIKARSLDVTKKPNQIFSEAKRKIREKFEIVDFRRLEPFQKDHAMIVVKK